MKVSPSCFVLLAGLIYPISGFQSLPSQSRRYGIPSVLKGMSEDILIATAFDKMRMDMQEGDDEIAQLLVSFRECTRELLTLQSIELFEPVGVVESKVAPPEPVVSVSKPPPEPVVSVSQPKAAKRRPASRAYSFLGNVELAMGGSRLFKPAPGLSRSFIDGLPTAPTNHVASDKAKKHTAECRNLSKGGSKLFRPIPGLSRSFVDGIAKTLPDNTSDQESKTNYYSLSMGGSKLFKPAPRLARSFIDNGTEGVTTKRLF